MNYFDYAASTPLHPEAAHVYLKLSQQCFGNTTSLHDYGTEAQNILVECRRQLGELLGVPADGLYFTSGGTESNLLSVISLAKAQRKKGRHIVISAGEHPSVFSAVAYLEEQGFTSSFVPFDAGGRVDLERLQNELTEQTIVVSVQHSNPEIGTIQPIQEISRLLRSKGILFHSDCVQSLGKLDLTEVSPLVDSLTVSAHKVYGPKGVGAAYIDPKLRMEPLFPGIVHERGFRGGTVNVPAIAAFVTAVQLSNGTSALERFWELRNELLSPLRLQPGRFTIYEAAQAADQLPQIVGLGVTHTEGQLVMLELNRRGFAISTGSACQVGQLQTSTAMTALQVDREKAKEFIRISFGSETRMEQVQSLSAALQEIADEQSKRQLSSGSNMHIF